MGAAAAPSLIASTGLARSGGGWRVEPVDESGVHILEAGIEAAGVLADEVNHFAIAVSRLPVLAAGLVHHAEAVVAVVLAGESHQEVAGCLLGLVEFACMNQVHHGVGCVREFIGVVVGGSSQRPGDFLRHAGQVWRGGGRLDGGGEPFAPGGFILRQAALLVLVATSAGAGIIASGLGMA